MKYVAMMLSTGVMVFMLSIAASAGAEDTVSAAQIAAAKTSADHAAIAKEYELAAAAADREVEAHERMAQTYRTVGFSGKAPNGTAIAKHCDRLVTQYKAIAVENRKLAAAHDQMAKDCCTSPDAGEHQHQH